MSKSEKSENKNRSVTSNNPSANKKADRERNSKKPGVHSDSAPIGGG